MMLLKKIKDGNIGADLGVEINGNIMCKILNRDNYPPCSNSQIFNVFQIGKNIDKNIDKNIVNIKIYQGKNYYTKNNKFLKSFEFIIEPIINRTQKIHITFSLDSGGILNIKVINKINNYYINKQIQIENFSNFQIINHNDFENNLFLMKEIIKKTDKKNYQILCNKCDDLIIWIRKNVEPTRKEFLEKIKQMEKIKDEIYLSY